MFSLRSNSIESRFRSIRGQFFGSSRYDFEKKQKQDQKRLGIRFAHQLFTRYARFRKQTWKVRTHAGCSAMQVIDG